MADDYRDDDLVQKAARNLFVGAAPERHDELSELWDKLKPTFHLTDEILHGDKFVMEAGAYKFVRFNHRALRLFWLAAYVAWEGYTAIHKSKMDGARPDLSRFQDLLAVFRRTVESPESDKVPLPTGVPEPGTYARTNAIELAPGEQATIAAAWALLHEMHHIELQQQGKAADPHETDPSARRAEEIACDLFATKFLDEQIERYAETFGEDSQRVRQKRHLGIYFALFAVTLLARDRWGATDSHPAVKERLRHARTAMTGETEIADVIAHMAFAALRIVWLGAPSPFA